MAKQIKQKKPAQFITPAQPAVTEVKNNIKLKRGLLIIIILLLGLVIMRPAGKYISRLINPPAPIPTQAPDQLPKNWSYVTDIDDKRILAKAEKVVNSNSAQNVPAIIITKSETQSKDYDKYVDELIAGTKKSMPGIVYEKDTIIKNIPYVRMLTGYYWSNDQKIIINQQIAINKNKEVYTITGSYVENKKDASIQDEINQVFTLLSKKYIHNN